MLSMQALWLLGQELGSCILLLTDEHVQSQHIITFIQKSFVITMQHSLIGLVDGKEQLLRC